LNDFDSYARWLKIPAERRPPSYYDLLGLPAFESDCQRIRAAGMERSAHVRRYCLGQHGAEATKLLGELAAAFACLVDPAHKAAYDARLAATNGLITQAATDVAAARPPRPSAAKRVSGDRPPPIVARDHQAAHRPSLPAARLSALRRRKRAAAPVRILSAAALGLALLLYASYRRHLSGDGTTSSHAIVAQRQEPEATGGAAPREAVNRPHTPTRASQRPSAAARPTASSPARSKGGGEIVDPAVVPDAAPLVPAPPSRPLPPADDSADDIAPPAAPEDPDDMADPSSQPDAASDEAAQVARMATGVLPENVAPSSDAGDDETSPFIEVPPTDDEPPSDGEPPIDAEPAPWSAGQVAGPMDSNGADGKFWRSRAQGRQQEWLELWFTRPVPASFLQIYLVQEPVTFDRIIVYPETGEPKSLVPKHVPVDLFRGQLFTFGVRPIETRHVKLLMHSPGANRVEIDAVALLTKSQDRFWPEAAKARTTYNQPASTDGPMVDDEAAPSAANPTIRRVSPE
jgi:hypothetical protein